MPRRRGDGPGHTRARRKAQEAAVRGLVADAVAEAHEAHAAAQCDLMGSARAFSTGGRSSGKSGLAPPCSSSSSRPAGTRGGSWGSPPPTSMGQHPYPAPPPPAPAARGGVHTFLRTQEVTAATGVHLARLPPTPLDDPRGPRALGPAPDWELWHDAWAAWLPRLPSQCRWMAAGPRPCGADATAGPPPPPPLPPAEHHKALPTARH